MAVRLSALHAGRPLPPGRFLVLISVRVWVDPRAIVRLEELGELEKSNDLIGTRSRDLPACSIVPQPTTLPRAPSHRCGEISWPYRNSNSDPSIVQFVGSSYFIYFFNWYSGVWSPIGSTRHCDPQIGLLCQPRVIMMMEKLVEWWLAGETEILGKKTCPSAALSTTNRTCCPEANPGRRGAKPATNRFTYGTALGSRYNDYAIPDSS
jgi:hypothetical protein